MASIPDGFVPLVGSGFANELYEHTDEGLILKIYREKEYFDAEMTAFDSGFSRMPHRIGNGSYREQNYILMTKIGDTVTSFTSTHAGELVETLAKLHTIRRAESVTPEDFLGKYFNRVHPHAELISTILHINVHSVIGSVRDNFCRDKLPLSLVHGDLSLSNIRMVGTDMHLIDFDEAGYAIPEWEFARLLWSDIEAFNTIEGLQTCVAMYNELRGTQYMLDERMKSLVALAGADWWLWISIHIPRRSDIAEVAAKRFSVINTKYGT